MKQTIVFDRPASLNKIINSARTNKFASANKKKAETRKALKAVIAQNIQPYESKVFMYVEITYKSVLNDPDNLFSSIKPVLDGLTSAGILEDDNTKFIHTPILYDFYKAKTGEKETLTITFTENVDEYLEIVHNRFNKLKQETK